jgi:hypothetical protein
MDKLASFYVVPGYTFFYWGFTFPKKHYDEHIQFFDLKEGQLVRDIRIKIDGKFYPAKIRMARQNNSGKSKGRSDRLYPVRDVVQVFYDSKYDTLKALRKLFIYSYASTIDKSKPKLKELLEFIHLGNADFRIKPISQQTTDFDDMFRFMEDKNLFKFWKDKSLKTRSKEKIILNYSRKWLKADQATKFKDRNNVIYLLYHSKFKNIYVGKANNLGSRVKAGQGRVGLKSDWDKFMWFELNPDYNMFLEELEHFLIKTFASILENNLDIEAIIDSKVTLVNRQLKRG